MDQLIFISIVLDARRKKANNKYPVKLRVFSKSPRKQKLYSTIFEMSKKEFGSVWETLKPRSEHKLILEQLRSLERRANDVLTDLKPFSFEQFEKKLFRKRGQAVNVNYLYEEQIEELKSRQQFGTAIACDSSRKSLSKYTVAILKQSFDQLTLYDITPKWLLGYEFYMINEKKNSPATVGVYLRDLRTIFNIAIFNEEIKKSYYPFGKKLYQLPATTSKKKALSNGELRVLFNAVPRISQQELAKDFWFFSYFCNGMNFKDIAMLQYKNLSKDKLEFYREKTKNTSKANLKLITVCLNEFTKGVIDRYGNKNRDGYIFSILEENTKPSGVKRNVNNFNRLVGQHIKNLAEENGMERALSPVWARHTFATKSLRDGASLELMKESLGHSDMKTTVGYFAGFEDDAKKEIANNLMNF